MPLPVVSAIGFVVLTGLAWLCSQNRRAIAWRTVAWGLTLQLLIGLLVFRLPGSQRLFLQLNAAVLALLDSSKSGTRFLLGPLAAEPGEAGSIGFILAFQVLPVAPRLVLTAIGAYQLEEVLKASARLGERRVPHTVVYMLEPGRFRRPRRAGEQRHAAPTQLMASLDSDAAPARLFVSHTRPEVVLGVLQPLHTGYGTTSALGFIGQGGTLTVAGMLFVSRSTWAHILDEAARLLGISRKDLLTVEELAALDGQASPHGTII